ncbi:MAG: fimbria/pilus outer membrane usher protein, partial [Gammaproteobacteria bacterium]|nr:fimbria/pilus outer membrane usher protein [Gammaproteobacteria bacterium]
MRRRFLSQLFFLLLFSSASFAHEYVPMLVMLNQVEHEHSVVVLRDDGDVWLTYDELRRMDTLLPLQAIDYEGKSYVSLREHKNRLVFHVDIENLLIEINIRPIYLKSTRIDYAKEFTIKTTPVRNTAFLNYALFYRGSSEQDYSSWELPLEGVVSVNGIVIKSNYFYRQILDETLWTRGLTSISHDSHQGRQRLIVGDYFATSGAMGGSGIFSGISISRNQSFGAMSFSNPGLSVGGMLETPSRVDVYANDVLVRTEELPAGPYNLENIPNVFGAGDASLVITDSFGRQKTFNQAYYVSSQLLQKGMSEFSYSIGWRRNQVDALVLEYDSSPSVLAYHRKGITPYFSAGYHFDYDADLWNVRPSVALLLKQYGELELLGAYSHYKKRNGYAAMGRYSYVGRRFHLRASINFTNPAYGHLSFKPEVQTRHITQNYSAGIHGHKLGSFSVVYARSQALTGADISTGTESVVETSEVISLLYNRRVTRTINLFLRGSQIKHDVETENSFLFGVHAILGRKMSSNYSYKKNGEVFTNSIGFQRTAPLGRGIGLRARALKDNRVEGENNIDGDASLNLKGDHGIINLSYYRSHSLSSTQYSLSGALALMDSHFYISRPIYDSFGVTRVGKLDDVDVFLASEHMGNTTQGRLLIPNLASYSPNRIKIDGEDIPVDVMLSTTENIVVPTPRSGSLVEFSVERFQAISGTIIFNDFGVKRVPEFASLSLHKNELLHESIVGKGGLFYFENVSPGIYQAEL